MRRRLPTVAAELQKELDSAESKRRVLIHRHGDTVRDLAEEEAELKALQGRRENLPAWLGDLRRGLCAELRLKDADLRFVAELISVKEAERVWEPSIEMLLRGFALTLLVPERHYALVSSYVERTQLRDSQGAGSGWFTTVSASLVPHPARSLRMSSRYCKSSNTVTDKRYSHGLLGNCKRGSIIAVATRSKNFRGRENGH